MDVERRAVAAVKWAAAGRLASQLVTWAITIFVMRLLQPADYGLMALVAVATTVAAAVSEAGINSTIIQAKDLDDGVLRKLAGLTLVANGLLFAAVVAVAPLASAFFGEPRLQPLMQVAALQFILAGIGAVPQSLAARNLRFKMLAGVDLAGTVATALVTLLMAWSGWGVWSLVGGSLFGAALRVVLLLASGGNVRPSFDLRGLSAPLGFGSRMALATILWSLILQSDALIGGRFLDATQLGIYAVSLHLATLPMQKLMSVVNQVAFATVARLQDEAERLRSRLLLGQRLMASLAVPALWGLAAVAPELIGLLLGGKWEQAVVPLQLVAAVVPLRMTAMLLSTAVLGVGRADIALRVTLTAGLVWPVCFAIGAQWGPVGLAASWLVAVPLAFALNLARLCRAMHLASTEVMRAIAPAISCGAIMVAAVVLVRAALPVLPPTVALATLVVAGALAYFASILVVDRTLRPALCEILRSRSTGSDLGTR